MEIGDTVQFKVTLNAKGQPQARDVEKVPDSDNRKSTKENETPCEPPNDLPKFTGTLRSFNVDSGFAFLDSEEANTKFGHSDVFLHKNYIPAEMGDLSQYPEGREPKKK